MEQNKLAQYQVKYFDKNEWHYLGFEYLNSYDSQQEKEKQIERIHKKNNLPKSAYLNISNFFNVYC